MPLLAVKTKFLYPSTSISWSIPSMNWYSLCFAKAAHTALVMNHSHSALILSFLLVYQTLTHLLPHLKQFELFIPKLFLLPCLLAFPSPLSFPSSFVLPLSLSVLLKCSETDWLLSYLYSVCLLFQYIFHFIISFFFTYWIYPIIFLTS